MVDLTPILHHVPAWLMVLFRLAGVFVFAPVLGSQAIPRQVKALLAIGLSLAVYPVLLNPGRPAAAHLVDVMGMDVTMWALLPMAALELLIGFVIGYGATLPLVAMQAGGQIINQQMGLGAAGVFNPELGDQSGPVGQLLFLLGVAIFLMLGGHQAMMTVLVGSFDHIPIGGLTDMEAVVHMVLGLFAVMMELVVRVSAPILTLLFLESVAMGFIARTVPQMNILSVGFTIRIMMSVVLLAVILGTIATVGGSAILETMDRIAKLMMGHAL